MKRVLGIAVLSLLFFGAQAQSDISDDDLYNYALMELSKEALVSQISPMVNDLIAQQEGMTGQRFQELQKAKGDFASVEALDWEIKFFELVDKKISDKKGAATDIVKIMASKLVGASTYKAIKDGLKSDADLKSRYDAMKSTMKSASAS